MSIARTVASRKQRSWPAFAPVVLATIGIFTMSAIFVPRATSGLSLQSMLPLAAVLAVAAVGQTLVIQQRGIDLSVGGTIGLSAMMIGVATTRWGWDVVPSLFATFAVCAIFGVLNAVLVALLNITPLVATLAMNAIITGAVVLLTDSAPATAPTELTTVVMSKLFGQPLIVWIALLFVSVMAVVTVKTVEGRRFVAAGSSPAAARVSGVRVNRSIFMAYITASLSYSLAGVMLAGYLRNVGIGVGGPYMLSVIAVVIVGGTPLVGGKGTIVGSAIAALFMSQLVQLVLTIGAPTSIQMLIQAIAIAAAATLQGLAVRVRRKKVEPERIATATAQVQPG